VNVSKTQEPAHEHQHVWSQLPWYVNASIGERDRERVDSHLVVCAACRAELQQQRLIQRAMSGDSGVDHISSGSLNRLRQRLDAISAGDAGKPAKLARPRQRALLAASVGIVAVAVAVLTAVSHRRDAQPHYPDNYYTVSSAIQRSPQEVIRAVFAPTVTVVQLQRLLDESHLKIVGGPTEAGVYSLAQTGAQPVNDALARLRQNPAVRFAESTAP
jgi:hypothetical protein